MCHVIREATSMTGAKQAGFGIGTERSNLYECKEV